MQYLAQWPEYFQVAELPSGEVTGCKMGKAEGHGENWHGHVTALTVSPRCLGLAATLITWLEYFRKENEPTSWTCLSVYRTKFQSTCTSVLVTQCTEQY